MPQVFSLGEKKGFKLLNPFRYMVGRERFERSTSGLKVIAITISLKTPSITQSPLLYYQQEVSTLCHVRYITIENHELTCLMCTQCVPE